VVRIHDFRAVNSNTGKINGGRKGLSSNEVSLSTREQLHDPAQGSIMWSINRSKMILPHVSLSLYCRLFGIVLRLTYGLIYFTRKTLLRQKLCLQNGPKLLIGDVLANN